MRDTWNPQSYVAKLAGILPENPLTATMNRSLTLFVYALTLLSASISPLIASAASGAALDAVLARAQAQALAQQPGWLMLLHYKHESLSLRYQSQTDDAAFFLAPEGKISPEAELHADLQAMLQPSAPGHAQCLFPARWYWLKQQLQLNAADVACPRLEAWLDKMQSTSVSLVFPAMYLNNPGSSFGHTYLRFNHPQSALLSHTLNYAAEAHEDNIASYVYKGLFGGYRGVFRTRPYYETVQVYSNLENRDIWEYRLDLNSEEIEQLKRHVWEVVDIDFDYFFLRENCAYRLLALLDAVRPEAGLSSYASFPLYAIPVDTVRALEQAGMIVEQVYRPSLVSEIEAGMANYADDIGQAALDLADGRIDINQALVGRQHANTRAAVLDTAYQILRFRQQNETPAAQAILDRRSEIPEVTRYRQPAPMAPEQGHASARVSLSVGKIERKDYFELAIKPAFHDLLDAPGGYVTGAEINAFDLRLRWLPEADALQLQQLRFYNVMSLSPWQSWYRPLSWQLDIKLYRQFITPQSSDLVFNTRLAAGISQSALDSLWFAMLSLDAEGSDDYAQGYSVLAGVQLGMSAAFENGQFLLSAERNVAVAGYDLHRDRLNAGLQLNLSVHSALRVNFEKVFYDRFAVSDLRASMHVYF